MSQGGRRSAMPHRVRFNENGFVGRVVMHCRGEHQHHASHMLNKWAICLFRNLSLKTHIEYLIQRSTQLSRTPHHTIWNWVHFQCVVCGATLLLDKCTYIRRCVRDLWACYVFVYGNRNIAFSEPFRQVILSILLKTRRYWHANLQHGAKRRLGWHTHRAHTQVRQNRTRAERRLYFSTIIELTFIMN